MPKVTITGLKELKGLSKLGEMVKQGNKTVWHESKDKTFKTLVGNMTRIDTGSLIGSAEAKEFPDGFFCGVGKGNNSRTGKPVKNYSIPQDLGFQHYRNGRIRGTNATKIAVDTHMQNIVDDLNTVVFVAITRALYGAGR
jgi:hypothetical protein